MCRSEIRLQGASVQQEDMLWPLLSCGIEVPGYRMEDSPGAAWKRLRDVAYVLSSLSSGGVLG